MLHNQEKRILTTGDNSFKFLLSVYLESDNFFVCDLTSGLCLFNLSLSGGSKSWVRLCLA